MLQLLGSLGGKEVMAAARPLGAACWHAVKQIRGLGHSLKGKEN